jgi:prolyl-tRNA synthetase
MISSHSDDKGLIIPPNLSEFKAVILPIYGKENEEKVNAYVEQIAQKITGSTTKAPYKGEYFKKYVGTSEVLVDFRNVRLGEKITDFELSGYPVRIECGERDIENNMLVISSRITGEKQIISIDQVTETIERMMTEGQVELLKRSRERLLSNVVACETLEDI